MCFFLFLLVFFFFCKQKTAYDMRISDWSSDVCSSDLSLAVVLHPNTATVEVSLADLALEDGVGVALDERRCRGLAGFLGREGAGIVDAGAVAAEMADGDDKGPGEFLHFHNSLLIAVRKFEIGRAHV